MAWQTALLQLAKVRMRYRLPYASPGQRVGLLGGSFDPAHHGHVHITQEAMKRFGLDVVWWLVSPGNPLKQEGPQPLDRRLDQARRLVSHPRILVTDIETQIGTRFTANTLDCLRRIYPSVRFTWLMGADNLHQFHKWQRWRDIMELMPVGVLARPGDRINARTSVAARVYRSSQVSGAASHTLGQAQTPAWCFVNVPMRSDSSSAIRAAGKWV